jgi:hypothetical protein
MKPGDHIIVFLKDVDVMINLLQLLHHRPDVGVTTRASGSDLCIDVKKINMHDQAPRNRQPEIMPVRK